MHPLAWSRSDTEAVIAAIKCISTERGAVAATPLHQAFLEGLRDHIFHQPDIDLDAIDPIAPDGFAAAIRDPEHRTRALEYLTVVPYIRPDISEAEADLVGEFFAALHLTSDSLKFLSHVAHHHIFLSQLCLARKLMPRLLPGGPITQLSRAVRMLRESRGNAAIAAPYQALEKLPAGTLGNAFFRFYRNRGFALPGEPGCMPEELLAVHDLGHILSGYNTDHHGEILAQAFVGGAQQTNGMMIAVTGLLSFHNAVVFDAGGRLQLHRGNLEPPAFAEAFARGMSSLSFMSGWDFKADWTLPVDAVRARFRITGAADVWDDPPPPV